MAEQHGKPRKKPVRRTISQRSELINDLHVWGINPDTREIVLMSNADNAEDGIDWTCANTFIKNMLLLNSMNHLPILVHQCTGGGDWSYGMAIYDAIATSPSPVTLLAHALASSMSSIIPQAAKKRVIMPRAHFMVHFGSAGYEGDSRSFVSEAREADHIDQQMLEIYTNRCMKGNFFRRNKYSKDKTREFLRKRMNEIREWYMTPVEAVDMGFMDGVYGAAGFQTLDEIRQRQ
ncbi:MAG: ATP-dependent Clp protease proteolytic subunit [Thermoguttaceae bacterium]